MGRVAFYWTVWKAKKKKKKILSVKICANELGFEQKRPLFPSFFCVSAAGLPTEGKKEEEKKKERKKERRRTERKKERKERRHLPSICRVSAK